MLFLTRAIRFAAIALAVAIAICVVLVVQRYRTECGFGASGHAPCPVSFHISWPFTSTPPVDRVGGSSDAATNDGCAVFGATLAGCQSFPGWTSGTWGPPPNITAAHVLIVGGGGGGSGQVVSGPTSLSGNPIFIAVGTGGQGAQGFSGNGFRGEDSRFGDSFAEGGQTGGSPDHPVFGGNSGNGIFQPMTSFSGNYVAAGSGGGGGSTTGAAGSGCGGGGGGVLLGGQGPSAMSGQSIGASNWPCRGNEGFSGEGGTGYGAGGGGGGNFAVGDPGGNGAQGVVYVEW